MSDDVTNLNFIAVTIPSALTTSTYGAPSASCRAVDLKFLTSALPLSPSSSGNVHVIVLPGKLVSASPSNSRFVPSSYIGWYATDESPGFLDLYILRVYVLLSPSGTVIPIGLSV